LEAVAVGVRDGVFCFVEALVGGVADRVVELPSETEEVNEGVAELLMGEPDIEEETDIVGVIDIVVDWEGVSDGVKVTVGVNDGVILMVGD